MNYNNYHHHPIAKPVEPISKAFSNFDFKTSFVGYSGNSILKKQVWATGNLSGSSTLSILILKS